MKQSDLIQSIETNAKNRRVFLRNIGIAGAALGVAGKLGFAQSLPAGTPSDVDILNFALNLEYLEAEFYTYATTGKSIAQSGITVTGSTGTATTGSAAGGTISGGSMVTFGDTKIQAIATEIAANERAHVTLLRQAITGLGGTPIAEPNINLAALGIGFGNQSDFLVVARALEDVGVTAYLGAAPLIQNKSIAATMARILAVEGMHAGALRVLVAQNAAATRSLDSLDHLPLPTGTQYFNTNAQGLAETRTSGQVLALAFGKATVTSGGFFPNGINGTINTSSAAASAASNNGTFFATPNPVTATSSQNPVVTFNVPGVSAVEIRANSPNGVLLGTGSGSGSIVLGSVTNGMVLYLQDVSNGRGLTAANTLATLTINVQSTPTTTGNQ